MDVRYRDEVKTTFGDVPEGAGLNVPDVVQDVGTTWRLWMEGIHIDIMVPADKTSSAESTRDPALRARVRGSATAPTHIAIGPLS